MGWLPGESECYLFDSFGYRYGPLDPADVSIPLHAPKSMIISLIHVAHTPYFIDTTIIQQ